MRVYVDDGENRVAIVIFDFSLARSIINAVGMNVFGHGTLIDIRLSCQSGMSFVQFRFGSVWI